MRFVRLACKNHPDLRWCCKSIAWTDGEGYNGCRGLFFYGDKDGNLVDKNEELLEECTCTTEYLVRAPEDVEKFPERMTPNNNS